MHLFQSYFHYMREPEQALWVLLEERSLSQACAGYLAAALAWVLFFNMGDGLTVPVFLFKLALVFVTEIIAGCFLAAFCGLFLDLFKVGTSPVKLFVLIGSAGFIKGLLIAFALISMALPEARLGCLAPLGLLLVLGLQLGYLTRSVRRMYNVSYRKAVSVWILAFVPVIAAMFLLGVFAVWGLVLLA